MRQFPLSVVAAAVRALYAAGSSDTPIEPAISVSRSSGIAPLAVYFDASATTSPETSDPFHELYYAWNFDDAGQGNWTYGSRADLDKNVAYGPLAAHVFETPGTYTVTLTVFDGTNIETLTQTITVSAWSSANGNTLYVGNVLPVKGAGGVPDTADSFVAQSADFDDVINTVASNGATYKRILFNRGDTFTAASIGTIDETGPGIVGAYGTGAKPIIAGTVDKIGFGSSTNHTFGDWRLMDLEFSGGAGAGKSVTCPGTHTNFLMLRCDHDAPNYGIETSLSTLDVINNASLLQTPYDGTFIVDCTFTNCNSYGVFAAGYKIAILGCSFSVFTVEHGIRIQWTQGMVISANDLGTANRTSLTIRGILATELARTGASSAGWKTLPTGDIYTEDFIVSDNKVTAGATTPYPITLTSVNGTEDHRLRDAIVERNWIIGGAATTNAISTQASNISIRNNLMDVSANTANQNVISINKSTDTPSPPDSVHVRHNTMYSSATGTTFRQLIVSSSPTNVNYQNNLAYAPNYTNHALSTGTFGAGGEYDNNPVCNSATEPAANGMDDSPSFAGTDGAGSTPYTTPTHFQILTGSYGNGAGTDAIKVFDDFFGNIRDWQTPNTDMGFHALDTGALPAL